MIGAETPVGGFGELIFDAWWLDIVKVKESKLESRFKAEKLRR